MVLLTAACTAAEQAGVPESAATTSAVPGVEISGVNAVVTILTTNGADAIAATPVQGEWSFSAWVEVEGRAFLFDTGWSPENVLHNAEAMGLDLSAAEDLVLSHNHGDHTGGLETLRTQLAQRNPQAISRIHVARGIFASRPGPNGERNPMVALRARLEALGSTFVIHDGPAEIAPGVWVTGPVPRLHDERNYPLEPESVIVLDGDEVADIIPESQSMVVLAEGGPIFISGCGHSGLINTLDYGRAAISPHPPQAAIGGFHLFNASEETLRWTADRLADARLGNFIGAHCTGFEAVFRIRELAGMPRTQAAIGAIGTRFESGIGIDPGLINQ